MITESGHTVDARLNPTILTCEGIYFNFLHPREGISIEAIARGLSNICRFNGQTERFYSVAEHSVWVSRLVAPEYAAAALMHDAAEAFIGDVTKPLKNLLADYQAVEERVEQAVWHAFGLPAALHPTIKTADRQMLWIEQRQIMRNADGWVGTEPPEGVHGTPDQDAIQLECLAPAAAYRLFMDRAIELCLAQW